jgi:hypothetical protein
LASVAIAGSTSPLAASASLHAPSQ